jgi:error-prone DNA polymerase
MNGLREENAFELVRQRKEQPFASIEDFKARISCLTKEELRSLAEAGALNGLAEHRRAAMWNVEERWHDDLLGSARAARAIGKNHKTPLESFSLHRGTERSTGGASAPQEKGAQPAPLQPMTLPERVQADYETMNLTTGPHPMKLLRNDLPDVWRASDLPQAKHGTIIQIAGNVICRQRPGTAKGFVFISLEDETGVANAIVTPDLFECLRLVITEEPFLLIEGEVQNTENVVLVKAGKISPLAHASLGGSPSHDFH